MNRVLPPAQPQQQQPMSLTELLEQLIADVADTNTTTTTTTTTTTNDESGNDSVLIHSVDDRQRRRLIVVESMLRKELLPLQQRIKIDRLVDYYYARLKDDVHDMITDQRYGEEYGGLDSDRDTPEEVTAILQLVPEVLQKRKETKWHQFEVDGVDGNDEIIGGEWIDADDDGYDDDEGEYPIQCLVYGRDNRGNRHFNIKAVPFIHLFAQLALEYNTFDDDQRGGLFIEDGEGDNTITNLVVPFCDCYLSDENRHRADEVRTNELIQLRQMNLLTLADIRELPLFNKLCNGSTQIIFPQNSIRFIIEWSPTLLLQPCVSILSKGFPLLHSAAKTHSILNFRFIFEYMIRYFPYKKGITCLFCGHRMDGVVFTPFSLACDEFDGPQVMEVVEDVLAQVSGTTPINTVEAVVLAATDPNIQLDCLYFLIQRRPDVLLSSSGNSSRASVPSSRSTVNSSVVHDDDDDDNDEDSDDDIEGDGNNDGEENHHTKKTNRRDDDDDHVNTDTTGTTTASTTTTTLKRKRKAL